MSTITIDQRILIPGSPESIWSLLGDFEKHPSWRVDCEQINALSDIRYEPGARWRYTNRKGADFVIEILAYFTRVGFEYTIVDGLSLGKNCGRFRLQEVNEGTAVQWSFEFQKGGLLSRGGRRKASIETGMADSLRRLWQLHREQPSITIPPPRATVQKAPSVDMRAQYTPRHSPTKPSPKPPTLEDTQALTTLHPEEANPTTAPILAEAEAPPSSVEDTPTHPLPALGIQQTTEEKPQESPSQLESEDEKSIFEIFGIQHQTHFESEEDTQALNLIQETRTFEAQHELSTRIGARVRLRRRLVPLRRP